MKQQEEINRLFWAYRDGELSDDKIFQLKERLKNDVDFREDFLEEAAMIEAIDEEAEKLAIKNEWNIENVVTASIDNEEKQKLREKVRSWMETPFDESVLADLEEQRVPFAVPDIVGQVEEPLEELPHGTSRRKKSTIRLVLGGATIILLLIIGGGIYRTVHFNALEDYAFKSEHKTLMGGEDSQDSKIVEDNYNKAYNAFEQKEWETSRDYAQKVLDGSSNNLEFKEKALIILAVIACRTEYDADKAISYLKQVKTEPKTLRSERAAELIEKIENNRLLYRLL